MGGNQKKRNSHSKDNDDDDEMKIENIEFEKISIQKKLFYGEQVVVEDQ